ncbi:MAG: O-methyltransferase [Planctomycetes bacterium]|nr:O-methyltransferase [Planctomycetota bacterium]MBL7143896.1 O-methyltransferase [Phycisphaerae bacterium]
MAANKKRLLVTICTAVLIFVAAGCAGSDNSIKSSSAANISEEAKILNVLEDMSNDQNYAQWNITPEEGKLLRILTATADAKNVVEIGTSNGYSTIWFCLALRATGGRITTHEIDPYRISLARENFKKAGVSHIVTIVEGDAHKTVSRLKEPIDILYIDADKDGYFDYFTKLLPLMRPGGLILAHNTTDQASEMQDFLKAITNNPELETIFLHKQPSGLSVTLKKRR